MEKLEEDIRQIFNKLNRDNKIQILNLARVALIAEESVKKEKEDTKNITIKIKNENNVL